MLGCQEYINALERGSWTGDEPSIEKSDPEMQISASGLGYFR